MHYEIRESVTPGKWIGSSFTRHGAVAIAQQHALHTGRSATVWLADKSISDVVDPPVRHCTDCDSDLHGTDDPSCPAQREPEE